MNEATVKSMEDLGKALNEASDQMNRIMFSSAINPWLLAGFHDIIDFEEFLDVTNKLNEWSQEFNIILTRESI